MPGVAQAAPATIAGASTTVGKGEGGGGDEWVGRHASGLLCGVYEANVDLCPEASEVGGDRGGCAGQGGGELWREGGEGDVVADIGGNGDSVEVSPGWARPIGAQPVLTQARGVIAHHMCSGNAGQVALHNVLKLLRAGVGGHNVCGGAVKGDSEAAANRVPIQHRLDNDRGLQGRQVVDGHQGHHIARRAHKGHQPLVAALVVRRAAAHLDGAS